MSFSAMSVFWVYQYLIKLLSAVSFLVWRRTASDNQSLFIFKFGDKNVIKAMQNPTSEMWLCKNDIFGFQFYYVSIVSVSNMLSLQLKNSFLPAPSHANSTWSWRVRLRIPSFSCIIRCIKILQANLYPQVHQCSTSVFTEVVQVHVINMQLELIKQSYLWSVSQIRIQLTPICMDVEVLTSQMF